jgi:hypothetical protein
VNSAPELDDERGENAKLAWNIFVTQKKAENKTNRAKGRAMLVKSLRELETVGHRLAAITTMEENGFITSHESRVLMTLMAPFKRRAFVQRDTVACALALASTFDPPATTVLCSPAQFSWQGICHTVPLLPTMLQDMKETTKRNPSRSSLDQAHRKMSKQAAEMARLLARKGKLDPNRSDRDNAWKAVPSR